MRTFKVQWSEKRRGEGSCYYLHVSSHYVSEPPRKFMSLCFNGDTRNLNQVYTADNWHRQVSNQACLLFFFFSFIFISWRLITLQYCSGFCHTLTRISHGFTCIPHPSPPSHLPPHPIPLSLPSAPALSTCLMHPTPAGDLFHT